MRNDCKIVWGNCLQFIQEKVSEQGFQTWFKPIIPKKLENHTLTIQVPSQFFYEWLEEHYLSLLQQVIQKELGPQGRLEYSIIVDQGTTRQKPFTIKLPLQPTNHTQQHRFASNNNFKNPFTLKNICLLYTSPSPRD